MIPPAWQDVWIAADPLAHIQAVGIDTAGRKQYLYHPLWRVARDRRKFVRALDLAAALPSARAQVTKALKEDGQTKERALAIAFRLLDDAALRIGSERYLARHGSRGLTTLRRRDVRIDGGDVALSFPAKSGQTAAIEITDESLAEALTDFASGASTAFLLAYRKGRRRVKITPAEVNTYLKDVLGPASPPRTSAPSTARSSPQTPWPASASSTAADSGTRPSASRCRRRRPPSATRPPSPATATSTLGCSGSTAGRTLDLDVTPETAIRRLLGGPETSRKVNRRGAGRRG